MGEAMRDLLSYTPETPAQLARNELDQALRLVHDLVLAVDLGKDVVFPCRADRVLQHALAHISRARTVLSEHREALEKALYERKPWKVSWEDLVLLDTFTGEEMVYTDAWTRRPFGVAEDREAPEEGASCFPVPRQVMAAATTR